MLSNDDDLHLLDKESRQLLCDVALTLPAVSIIASRDPIIDDSSTRAAEPSSPRPSGDSISDQDDEKPKATNPVGAAPNLGGKTREDQKDAIPFARARSSRMTVAEENPSRRGGFANAEATSSPGNEFAKRLAAARGANTRMRAFANGFCSRS